MNPINSTNRNAPVPPKESEAAFSNKVHDDLVTDRQEFRLGRSRSILLTERKLRKNKSFTINRRLTMSVLDSKEKMKLIDKLHKEEELQASSGIDSTSFLLARLDKFEDDEAVGEDLSISIASPVKTPILKTEIGPEELSANYVPTSLPSNDKDAHSIFSYADILTPISSTFSDHCNSDLEVYSSISSIYESLPDWEFWCTTVQDYASVARNTPHLLSSKIRVGIPSVLRGMMWKTMSQSDSTNLETVYYQFLKESDFEYEKIILRDIPRTFPRLAMFSEESGPGQTRLFNIMKAYSLYDTEVGYCQGLGFMAGPLIMNLPEVEAFCVFVRLMETYDMRTMFTVRMEGLRLRLYQLGCLITKLLPSLADHLASYNISTALYASQWFLSLFAYTFPLTLVQRIYDVVFAEGAPETIMRIAIALLQKNEKHLLSLYEFDELIGFLTSPQLFEIYNNSATNLICDAIALSGEVSKKVLDELCEAYSKETDSGAFCHQKPSIPPKSSGWLKTIITGLYPETNDTLRSISRPSILSGKEAFFMDPENSPVPHQLKRTNSSATYTSELELDSLKKNVYDLQKTAESHLTALTQLRQDHIQLKTEMVYLKSEKCSFQEENDLLKHELNKMRTEYIDFQRQSRDTLLRQQAHIQVVEKQLLDSNLCLKQIQDERDLLLKDFGNKQGPNTLSIQNNFADAFRRFISKS